MKKSFAFGGTLLIAVSLLVFPGEANASTLRARNPRLEQRSGETPQTTEADTGRASSRRLLRPRPSARAVNEEAVEQSLEVQRNRGSSPEQRPARKPRTSGSKQAGPTGRRSLRLKVNNQAPSRRSINRLFDPARSEEESPTAEE